MEQIRSLLDPRTKMLMVLTIATVVIAGSNKGWILIAKILLVTVPCVLYLGEKKWKTAFLYVVVYSFALFGEKVLLGYTYGILNFLLVAVFMAFARFMPGFVMGSYLVSTTTVSAFMAAMERMHVPRAVSISLAVTFRFFPTLKEEYQSINKAMRIRGIRFGGGKPSKMVEYRLIPIMISSIKISDELSAAALTRGLGAPKKRTNICKIGFGIFDMICIGICMLSWILLAADVFIK